MRGDVCLLDNVTSNFSPIGNCVPRPQAMASLLVPIDLARYDCTTAMQELHVSALHSIHICRLPNISPPSPTHYSTHYSVQKVTSRSTEHRLVRSDILSLTSTRGASGPHTPAYPSARSNRNQQQPQHQHQHQQQQHKLPNQNHITPRTPCTTSRHRSTPAKERLIPIQFDNMCGCGIFEFITIGGVIYTIAAIMIAHRAEKRLSKRPVQNGNKYHRTNQKIHRLNTRCHRQIPLKRTQCPPEGCKLD